MNPTERTAAEFEVELKQIDPNFSVLENPNRPGLSNIFYKKRNFDLPVISTHLIKDIIDPSHRYQFPNGMYVRMHSRPEVLDRLKQFLLDYKDNKYEGYED